VTDWTGNKKSAYSILGANNHSVIEREKHDYYATPSTATEKLLERESFLHSIWEPACGGGHISEVLSKYGYKVISTDKYNYGYNKQNLELDFLASESDIVIHSGDIITNPPYKFAQQFVEKAMDVIPVGNKVAMFLKLTFLEGKNRRKMFEKYPPKYIYVASGRLLCAKNGEFDKVSRSNSGAVAYSWFIWEKGFSGDPTVRWFN
jgi:hypothetical protein